MLPGRSQQGFRLGASRATAPQQHSPQSFEGTRPLALRRWRASNRLPDPAWLMTRSASCISCCKEGTKSNQLTCRQC